MDRQSLERLINDCCPEMKVVGTTSDFLTAIKIIEVLQPDLIFWDIESPHAFGVNLMEHFDVINFDIICTSTSEKHAINAFRVSAADFLLKPITESSLRKMEAKIEKRQNKEEEVSLSKKAAVDLLNMPQRIVFPSQNGLLYFHPDEILYLNSEGRHTRIFLTNGTSSISTRSLKDCLESIDMPVFVRIHRSYAINLSHIRHYSKGKNSFVLMEKGIKIDVGKSFKEELSEIASFFIK